MIKKLCVVIILLQVVINYAKAQQDIYIMGIGSGIWLQDHKQANAHITIKTPFVHVFKNIHLWKPHLALGIGLGLTSYNVVLDETIGVDSMQHVNFQHNNINEVRKYKLNTTYLEVPVELRYRQNPVQHKHPFKVGIGARLCYLVSSHTKTKYYPSAPVSKTKGYDVQYLNDFTYGPQLRIGVGGIGLLAFYDMHGLFEEKHAATIRQCLLALCFNISFDKNKFKLPGIPVRPKSASLTRESDDKMN